MKKLMIAAAGAVGLLAGVGTTSAFADDAGVTNVTFVVSSSGMSLHGVGKMLKPENGPYDVYLSYAKSGTTLPAATRVWTGWADDLDTRFNQMLGGLEPSTTYNYQIYATDRNGAASETTSGKFTTGKIYYVDGTSGDDTANGLTEATAVKTPEQAVTLAKTTNTSGHEIRIAPGRYVMSKTLWLDAGYALVGTGTTADDVILDANYAVDRRIVNASVQHVTLANLTFAHARIETFNAYANWTYPGAAVRMGDGGGNSASKRYSWVTNCVFTANTNVNTGAGALFLEGGCKVADCRFENNYAGSGANNGCGMGGAVVVHVGADQTAFENCTFAGNTSAGSEGALSCATYLSGDALFTNAYGVVLTDCVFTNNVATNGGAIGGKVVLAKRCAFLDNSAQRGGVFTGGDWRNAVQWSTVMRDCTFRGNRASLYGGVFAKPWYGSGGPAYVFSNCVFEANYAVKGYSAFALLSGTLQDCVFRGNVNDDASYYETNGWLPGSAKGVCLFSDMKLVQNCAFSNNVGRGSCLVRAAYGGKNMLMDGCTFVANELRQEVTNGVEKSYASEVGTARSILFLKSEGKPALTVRNTLFANNTNFCGYGCAMITEDGALLTNDNVTVIGNRCTTSNDVNNIWWLGSSAGAHVSNGGTNVFRNCIVLDNRNIVTDGLRNFRGGTISFANCLEDGSTMKSTDEVTNYPKATMKFKDAEKGDYTPKRHSTAHNAGLLLDWMTGDAKDVLGNKRVFDDLPDIGAFENNDLIPGFLFIIR